MSHALEGTPKPGLTLTEQANGQRIGRSMFIGHSAGYLIVFSVIQALVETVATGLASGTFYFVGFRYVLDFDTTIMPPRTHISFIAGNLIVASIIFALQVLVWTDLIVRRRRDRGRSGVDGLVWMGLFIASQVLFLFDGTREAVRWLDLLVYAGALYLFVVLVILPGDTKENRYGAVPRPD
jgi:uncharacterized membrane protein YhaH (DUF805 family)